MQSNSHEYIYADSQDSSNSCIKGYGKRRQYLFICKLFFLCRKSISDFRCVYISPLQCLRTYRIKFGTAEIIKLYI